MSLAAKLLFIAAAGALGTLARFGLASMVQRLAGPGFPWGTTTVNLSGAFLFGLVWTLAEGRLRLGPEVRLVVLTGFMGAFTTFSTLMFETATLARGAEWLAAGLNLVGQNAVGLAALLLGLAVGRLL